MVLKAGLHFSLRELVKSELVTLLATEREKQAGECNKTFHFSLSWTHFLSLCLNTPSFSLFSSLPHPTLNLPPFSLSVSLQLSSSLPRKMPQRLHRILRWPALSPTERGNKGIRCTDFCVLLCYVCCGRGGNCLLLSCQQCPGKALSVHKATQTKTKAWDQGSNVPLLSLSQHYHHIHTKAQHSKPTHAFTDASTHTNTTQK